MLNLDLMQSRAGREIYQIGKMEGQQAGLIEGEQKGLLKGKQAGLIEGERLMIARLLEKRFGQLPYSLKIRLEQATLAELEQWATELLTATCLEDIFKMQ
jgi:predicted transposase YdaD